MFSIMVHVTRCAAVVDEHGALVLGVHLCLECLDVMWLYAVTQTQKLVVVVVEQPNANDVATDVRRRNRK